VNRLKKVLHEIAEEKNKTAEEITLFTTQEQNHYLIWW